MNEIELAKFAYQVVAECESLYDPRAYVPGSIKFRWYMYDDESVALTDREMDIVNEALARAFPGEDVQIARAGSDHDWDWQQVTWSGTPDWGSLRS